MSNFSFQSSMKELPTSLFSRVCEQMNVDDQWKRLLEYIPHRKDNRPRFGIDDENSFSMAKDPTKALLTAWSSDFVTISNLLKVLRQANFIRQAEIIENCIKGSSAACVSTITAFENIRSFVPEADNVSQADITNGNVSVPVMTTTKSTTLPEIGIVSHFKYETLRRCTNNFNRRLISEGGNLIGCGGSADVFRGDHLELGREIAVKRMKTSNDIKQFMNELHVLSRLKTHRNLLPFYGVSEVSEGVPLCIVYEYMPGGSLHDRLQTMSVTEVLTISQRLSIAEDSAEGLVYLHSQELIHRDVKSLNILLGKYNEAKLADYGITRVGPRNKLLTATEHIIGTKPYMSIEYCKEGRVSYQLDSYAYGIVLLELLTSLLAYDVEREESCLDDYVKEVGIHKLLDKQAGDWSKESVDAMFNLSNRLLALFPHRPTMTEVLPEITQWKYLI